MRLTEIFSASRVEALLGIPPEEGEFLPADCGVPSYASPAKCAMLHDLLTYLPGDVLWKVDSASMLCALEVRSPFLDHDVVQDAMELREFELLSRRQGKTLLRKAFADCLPAEVAGRPKQGFGVPLGQWFRNDLRELLHDTLTASQAFAREHLARESVETLLAEHQTRKRDHTHRLFALLMLELWWQEHPGVLLG